MIRAAVVVIAVLAAAVAVALALTGGDDGTTEPAVIAAEVDALGPVPADALWVSPDGSDAGPGTAERPWESIDKALGSAGPGGTVVLAPGTYGALGETIEIVRGGEPGAPVTLRGAPDGPRPRILGAFRIRTSHVRLAHLLLDGPTGTVQDATDENPRGEQVQLAIDAAGPTLEDIWIYDCEIRDSDWHAGIFLTHAEDIRIVGNHIHHNGDPEDPAQENLSHGIYWASGSGLIANNVIEANVARGIQLFPEPSGVAIVNNTIIENGAAGVQVAKYSSDNLIANNVVAFNGDIGIRSDSLARGGNVASTNLLWDNAGVLEEPGENLVITETIAEDPGFAEAGGYELSQGSAAVDAADPENATPFDILGRERPQGAAPDIGAYESW